jgi:hypothetical protein
MVAAEPYDGLWSGITGGLALAAAIVIAVSLTSVLLGLMGADNPILQMFNGNVLAFAGGALGLMLVFAIVGAVLGKRTG